MSLINVSIGVFPTSLTKNNCSITWLDTVRRDGSLRRSLPKRVGWFGYCVLQYSSSAHWDFSWRLSMCVTSDRPQASAIKGYYLLHSRLWFSSRLELQMETKGNCRETELSFIN